MARPPIHPGEILAAELEESGMNAASVAQVLHIPMDHITQVLNGERAISTATAQRLGQWLGTGPEFWLNLQTQYELRVAAMLPPRKCKPTL